MPKITPNNKNISQNISGVVEKGSENHKKVLDKELTNIQNRERALNSKKVINDNKLKETKATLIRQLFEMMESMGVDPNDLNSINEFLSNLESKDPDLVELFKAAFSNLTSDQDAIPQEGEPEPVANNQGLMSRFNNLGPETFRPTQPSNEALPPQLSNGALPPQPNSGALPLQPMPIRE